MDFVITPGCRARSRDCFHGITATLLVTVLVTFGAHQMDGGQKTKPPAQAEAIYAQGMQALQQGDLEAAQTAFERVARLVPGSAEAHNSLGWVLLAQEKLDAAIREFQVAVKLSPEFPQARINLANALLRSGNQAG